MKSNEKYIACLTEAGTYYAMIKKSSGINIFLDDRLVCHYDNDDVSGCVCDGELYYTKTGSNRIYITSPDEINGDGEQSIDIECYDSVVILKKVSNTKCIFILQGYKRNNGTGQYFAYNMYQRQILFILPINAGFLDMAHTEKNEYFMLCREFSKISQFEDDEDYKILYWISFADYEGEIRVKQKAYYYELYDSFYDRTIHEINYIGEKKMRFPLDTFFSHYMQVISISLGGKYVIFYSEDLPGYIISDYLGNVYRMFLIPQIEISQFFYNEENDTVITITEQGINHYQVSQVSEQAIKELNLCYNKILESKDKYFVRNSEKFRELFYKALETCQSSVDINCTGNGSEILVIVCNKRMNYLQAWELRRYFEINKVRCVIYRLGDKGQHIPEECKGIILFYSKDDVNVVDDDLVLLLHMAIKKSKLILPIAVESNSKFIYSKFCDLNPKFFERYDKICRIYENLIKELRLFYS